MSYENNKWNLPPDKHLPNKNEGSCLRNLQRLTGMTEKEIRKIKKYRILLAQARSKGVKPKRTKEEKFEHKINKYLCKKFELPKEHPTIVKYFKLIKDNYLFDFKNKNYYYLCRSDYYINNNIIDSIFKKII